MALTEGGVDFARINMPIMDAIGDCSASEAGNWFLGVEGARR